VQKLGAGITAAEMKVAAKADIVFRAAPWSAYEDTVAGLSPWDGRIVLDAMNAASVGPDLDDSALDGLFREARTYTTWQRRPVDDETLRDLYELLKWAPTSANASPAAVCVSSVERGQRAAPSGAGPGQHREDDDGSRQPLLAQMRQRI
jgi:hypothetical protein